MILTAYIDESGTHDGSPMTVMAGYLSSAEDGPPSMRSGVAFFTGTTPD